MDFPFPNNAPEGGNAGAATDDFWAFNPQQPPPMNAQADDTSLDELLALYQTANDAPPAPFAPMGEPESYPFDAAAGGDAFPAFDVGAAPFGDPATDAPFPAFGAEGDAFPAFGGDAPAFPAFGEAPAPGGDAFPAFDAGAAFGEAPAPGGFDMPFDSSVPPAPAADAGFGGFESVVPEAGAGGFDLGGFDSAVPPLGDAGGFPAFEAAPAAELPADFGDLGGPVFPAFGEEPAAAAPEAGAMEFPAFGADEAPAFPAFDAAPADDGLAELGDLSGGPVFEAFDAMPAAEEPMAEFPAFDEGAPMFPAFDAAPAAEAPAAFEAPPAAEIPTEFPAFGADEPVFPAFEAAGATFEAAPAGEEPAFGAFTSDDEGPLFPPLEAPAVEPTPAPAAAAPVADAAPLVFGEEELEEFVPDEEAPLFPAVTEGPVFPAFEAPAAEAVPEAPAELPDFSGDAFAFPPLEPAPEPLAAAPEPKVESAPVVPAVDPEQTLRYREVPAPEAAPAAAAPSFDAAALASLTGQEVVIKTPEDRRAANQQLTQVVGSLSTGLDEIQGRMAHLYADLQKAAVSRAPVDEIQRITADLANAKASVGEGSDLYKQALYLRQMADAYLQVLKEL